MGPRKHASLASPPSYVEGGGRYVSQVHTASQLVACEWIGHFGHEPENIARWPGFNQNLPPPEIPADFPEDWQVAGGELPARPGITGFITGCLMLPMVMNSIPLDITIGSTTFTEL